MESSPGVVAVGYPVASGEILAEAERACGCDEVVSLREQLRLSRLTVDRLNRNVIDAHNVSAGIAQAARAVGNAHTSPAEASLEQALKALNDAIEAYDNDQMPF